MFGFFPAAGFAAFLAKAAFVAVFAVAAPFIGSLSFWYCWHYSKGRRVRRRPSPAMREPHLLVKLLWLAPKRFVEDLFDKDPEFFPYQGLVIYTGTQGMGKTIAMVHEAARIQSEFPKAKCITNLAYSREDCALTHWRQLVDYNNGIYGVIVCLDELQNWFSSKQSKDFPPEMFEVITQNRKNRRIILATTQHFYQVAKDIRMQCTVERRCRTFFGVLTVVRSIAPSMDTDGRIVKERTLGMKCFVHSDWLRSCYDTYKVIESLAKSGFKERKEAIVKVVGK